MPLSILAFRCTIIALKGGVAVVQFNVRIHSYKYVYKTLVFPEISRHAELSSGFDTNFLSDRKHKRGDKDHSEVNPFTYVRK